MSPVEKGRFFGGYMVRVWVRLRVTLRGRVRQVVVTFRVQVCLQDIFYFIQLTNFSHLQHALHGRRFDSSWHKKTPVLLIVMMALFCFTSPLNHDSVSQHAQYQDPETEPTNGIQPPLISLFIPLPSRLQHVFCLSMNNLRLTLPEAKKSPKASISTVVLTRVNQSSGIICKFLFLPQTTPFVLLIGSFLSPLPLGLRCFPLPTVFFFCVSPCLCV